MDGEGGLWEHFVLDDGCRDKLIAAGHDLLPEEQNNVKEGLVRVAAGFLVDGSPPKPLGFFIRSWKPAKH